MASLRRHKSRPRADVTVPFPQTPGRCVLTARPRGLPPESALREELFLRPISGGHSLAPHLKRPLGCRAAPWYPEALLTDRRKAGKRLGDSPRRVTTKRGAAPLSAVGGREPRAGADRTAVTAGPGPGHDPQPQPSGKEGPAWGWADSPWAAGRAGQGARAAGGLGAPSVLAAAASQPLLVGPDSVADRSGGRCWAQLPAQGAALSTAAGAGSGALRAAAGGRAARLRFPAGTKEQRWKPGRPGPSSCPGRDPRPAWKPPVSGRRAREALPGAEAQSALLGRLPGRLIPQPPAPCEGCGGGLWASLPAQRRPSLRLRSPRPDCREELAAAPRASLGSAWNAAPALEVPPPTRTPWPLRVQRGHSGTTWGPDDV